MTLHTAIDISTISSSIEAIRQHHRRLDESVTEEHRRPQPDMSVLQSLKRERLRVKDEIALHEGLMRTLARGRIKT